MIDVDVRSCSGASNKFSCLQGVSLDTLEAANVQLCKEYFSGEFTWVPVIDGTYVVDRPYKTIQSGSMNGVSAHLPRFLVILAEAV